MLLRPLDPGLKQKPTPTHQTSIRQHRLLPLPLLPMSGLRARQRRARCPPRAARTPDTFTCVIVRGRRRTARAYRLRWSCQRSPPARRITSSHTPPRPSRDSSTGTICRPCWLAWRQQRQRPRRERRSQGGHTALQGRQICRSKANGGALTQTSPRLFAAPPHSPL